MNLLRIVFSFLVLLSSGGCGLLYQYQAISEKPPVGGILTPMAPTDSVLQPALTIPIAQLEHASNIAAGKVLPYSDSGASRIGSIIIEYPWPLHGCMFCEHLDVNWNFTVSQPAPIRVRGGNDLLSIDVPAKVSGQAGFSGDLARIFGLGAKNFGASAELHFASGFEADRNYCPTLTQMSLSHSWSTDPYLELVGKNCFLGVCVGPWHLNLRTQVDKQIKPQLNSIAQALQSNIPCQPVRNALAKVWKDYSLPVAIPYDRVYLNIHPKNLYIPRLRVTESDLMFAGRLDATIAVDTTPTSDAPLPLPQNTPSPVDPGSFSIAVPLATKYYTLETMLKQLISTVPLRSDTPFGPVKLSPKKVSIYPSGKKLALGVYVAVEFKYLIFLNTSGTVWLTAEPVFTDGGTTLKFAEVAITRKFDNFIWKVASGLLDNAVQNAIRDGFQLSLTPQLRKAEAELTTAISNSGQGSGINLRASNVHIRAGRIQTSDIALQVEGLLNATVEANLGEVRLNP